MTEFGEMSVEALFQAKAKYNPRKISEEEFEALHQSMKRWGVVEPIVFNRRTETVVGGHQRIDVAQLHDPSGSLPVAYVDIPEQEEKALNVALNRISGEWDKDALLELLDGVDADLLALTGFSEDELEALIDIPDIPGVEGEEGEGRDEPGDLVGFRFGEYQGYVDRDVYRRFSRRFEEIKEEGGHALLSDVVEAWIDG